MDSEILQLYIDQQLNKVEEILLGEHLKVCGQCRRALNQLKLLDWELGHQTIIEVPASLAQLRERTLDRCVNEGAKAEGNWKIGDMLNMQRTVFNGATSFTRYLPVNSLLRLVRPEENEPARPNRWLERLLGMKEAK